MLDADEDLVVYSEMIALTAFLLAVDGYWWWQLVVKDYAGGGAVLEFKFWQSLALLGVLGGFWLFGPLTGVGSDLAWLWPVMVLAPIAALIARMMMGFAGWKR